MALRASASALLVVASGCARGSDVDLVAQGSLVQAWTIEGATDVTRCPYYGAERMRVVVIDDAGSIRATELGACNFFRVRVVLPAGRYRGTATFVDAIGRPVSVTQGLPEFTIFEDGETHQTINFAAADFVSVQ